MPKVSVILVIYNAKQYIKRVFDSIFAQTHQDLEVIAVINGSTDGSKEMIAAGYPQVQIIDPGQNLFFAKGNNLAFKQATGEFFQLVNQDMVLQPDYIGKILRAFDDQKVAAATGKLLKYDFVSDRKLDIIDSTGVTISSSGRAKDRGQNEADRGQYDNSRDVFAVSGAAPMYRKSALEAVRYQEGDFFEYYDEDFYGYWEDVDLSWRFNRAGWKNLYVPEAVAYHGRTAGQAKGGYLHAIDYVKHHSKLPTWIRRLNYKNHILMYLKNSPRIHPMFVLREIIMLGYILVLETSTLGVVPELLRLIPRMRKKRTSLRGA
jgi:GT2 family glycosyltransferase